MYDLKIDTATRLDEIATPLTTATDTLRVARSLALRFRDGDLRHIQLGDPTAKADVLAAVDEALRQVRHALRIIEAARRG